MVSSRVWERIVTSSGWESWRNGTDGGREQSEEGRLKPTSESLQKAQIPTAGKEEKRKSSIFVHWFI